MRENANQCYHPKRKPFRAEGLIGGGAKGTRTLDLYNAIVALSQLSYSPVHELFNCSEIDAKVKFRVCNRTDIGPAKVELRGFEPLTSTVRL